MNATSVRIVEDVDLARRCVSGDAAAQRELFYRERGRVHAILYRILGANADVEDLLQEAFTEIFQAMAGFRGEASLGTWLDRITVRVAYGHLTRPRLEVVRLAAVPEPPSAAIGADERVMLREAAARLYAVLDKVPVSQRIAFTLHVVDGRPIREVARAMNVSVVATKVRIWRAWRAIRHAAKTDLLLHDLVSGDPPPKASDA